MIAIIRIHGQVEVEKHIAETLIRLRLKRKFQCVFINPEDKVKLGMLKKIKDYVSFGAVSDDLMKKIIEKRGQKDSEEKYKGYCRLHPPIGGFKSSTKFSAPRGILGKNKNISKLLERMI